MTIYSSFNKYDPFKHNFIAYTTTLNCGLGHLLLVMRTVSLSRKLLVTRAVLLRLFLVHYLFMYRFALFYIFILEFTMDGASEGCIFMKSEKALAKTPVLTETDRFRLHIVKLLQKYSQALHISAVIYNQIRTVILFLHIIAFIVFRMSSYGSSSRCRRLVLVFPDHAH